MLSMKRLLLVMIGALLLVSSASAYGLYVKCPSSVQVGETLKCSIDSDFPAGTSFNLVLYQSQYTATQISSQPVVIQDDNATQYRLYDTTGLPGGQYKVEAQFNGAEEPKLRSDSTTTQLVTLIDRSGLITITSPSSQNLQDALRVEGSIAKESNAGVQLEVKGPDGDVFGPQWIATKDAQNTGDGTFTQTVSVTSPGDYEASFTDSKGFIGTVQFVVTAPATAAPTTIVVASVKPTTMHPVNTVPTPWPTTTKSPLSPIMAVASIVLAGLVLVISRK